MLKGEAAHASGSCSSNNKLMYVMSLSFGGAMRGHILKIYFILRYYWMINDDDEPRQLKELQNGPCPNDEDVAHLAAKQAGAVSRDI
jgi:hypothetical protein